MIKKTLPYRFKYVFQTKDEGGGHIWILNTRSYQEEVINILTRRHRGRMSSKTRTAKRGWSKYAKLRICIPLKMILRLYEEIVIFFRHSIKIWRKFSDLALFNTMCRFFQIIFKITCRISLKYTNCLQIFYRLFWRQIFFQWE